MVSRVVASMSMSIRAAVIPAAGLGTRFLPATKAVPKELLPIVDIPAIQYVVDEAVGAGIDHIVVVSNRAKPAVEAYFQPSPDLIERMRRNGRDQLADRLALIGKEVKVTICYQDEPRGLGHAVGCARDAVGDQPFAVLLPDELMQDSSLLLQMGEVCLRSGGSVVGLKQVDRAKVSSYGVIDPAGAIDDAGVIAIRTMVEKPAVADAPSDLIIIGRYVLTADIFDEIANLRPGAGGELQLTDAMRVQADRGVFHGVLSDIARFDTGTPLGWLAAVIDYALADPAINDSVRDMLRARV